MISKIVVHQFLYDLLLLVSKEEIQVVVEVVFVLHDRICLVFAVELGSVACRNNILQVLNRLLENCINFDVPSWLAILAT
jgi:hypothetical protein